jgi:hypothetical protein
MTCLVSSQEGVMDMSKRKKTAAKDVSGIHDYYDEDVDENGFIEGELDFSKFSLVASFNFVSDNTESNAAEAQKQSPEALPKVQVEIKEAEPYELVDNRKLQTQPNGITPPVDGEYFDVSRTFKFRRSTVRMLNRLKAEHQDENVYLSSIVDEAIRYYFEGVLGSM